ncbi:hypothetical protein ACJRO7_017837 [Eucalyptus globulus]|uniref:Uncharacterized protein n=1 Tax=Eucalyptus globulus TaxID=34317 RepID=A0ABD3KVU4_EUCGL
MNAPVRPSPAVRRSQIPAWPNERRPFGTTTYSLSFGGRNTRAYCPDSLSKNLLVSCWSPRVHRRSRAPGRRADSWAPGFSTEPSALYWDKEASPLRSCGMEVNSKSHSEASP